MAGGWSKLWSLPGEGTTLEVWLPAEEADHVHSLDDDIGVVADVLPLPGRRGRPRVAAPAIDGRVIGSRGSSR
jgi:hypothetical protein